MIIGDDDDDEVFVSSSSYTLRISKMNKMNTSKRKTKWLLEHPLDDCYNRIQKNYCIITNYYYYYYHQFWNLWYTTHVIIVANRIDIWMLKISIHSNKNGYIYLVVLNQWMNEWIKYLGGAIFRILRGSCIRYNNSSRTTTTTKQQNSTMANKLKTKKKLQQTNQPN